MSRIYGCNTKHVCVLGYSTQGKTDYWQVKVKEEACNWQEVYSEDILCYRKVILMLSRIRNRSLRLITTGARFYVNLPRNAQSCMYFICYHHDPDRANIS